MVRRLFYKLDHDRFDVFVGVKISASMDAEIEEARQRTDNRRRADFIRYLLQEGLKSLRNVHAPVRKRSA